MPVTVKKLALAAALLHKGKYRSGALYLSALRRWHLETGSAWTELHKLVASDARRAIRRGIGPDRGALPLQAAICVAKVPYSLNGFPQSAKGWPAAGSAVAMVSSAWLCREVEVSSAF